MTVHLLYYTVSEPYRVSSQSLLWEVQTLLTNCLCGQFGAGVILSSNHFNLHRRTWNSTTRPVEMSCSYYPYWQGQRIHAHQSVLIVRIEVIPEHELWLHKITTGPILSKLGLIQLHGLVCRRAHGNVSGETCHTGILWYSVTLSALIWATHMSQISSNMQALYAIKLLCLLQW